MIQAWPANDPMAPIDLMGVSIPNLTNESNQFYLHRGELQAYISAYCSLKESPPAFVSVSLPVYRRLARVAGTFRLTCAGVPILTLSEAANHS